MMKALKKTIVEFFLLGMVGLMIGFTANGLRAKNSLQFTKNYFDFGTVVTIPGHHEPGNTTTTSNDTTAEKSTHPKHPYQEITHDEVLALLNDPNTELGLNVFVDARNENNYSEGHIPGSYQCDPYDIGSYIDGMIDHVLGAEKVVVYCGGGNCEDSIFMCRELLEMEVPMEAIYLFMGGWKEWVKNDSPIETGSDPSQGGESEYGDSSSEESQSSESFSSEPKDDESEGDDS